MSLRHALLGLLAEGPASGYDLARRFQEELGAVWPAQHPQIYAELSRLTDAGFIEVDSRGPRRRTAYRITEAGREELRRWLNESEVDHTLRMEPLLRSFFFWLMEPQELKAHLEREHKFFSEMARTAREYGNAKDRGVFGTSPRVRAQRAAVEAAVRLNESLAEWTEWVLTSEVMTSEDFGTAGADGAEEGAAGAGEPTGG